MQPEELQKPKSLNINYSKKDFDTFAFFESKAKNYAFLPEARLEETMANGESRVAKDDDGKKMVGLRIEFNNHQKRLERTPENKKIIEILEKRCVREKELPLRFQQIRQVFKPVKMVPETKMQEALDKKDAEIKKLRDELKQGIPEKKTEDKKDKTLSEVI